MKYLLIITLLLPTAWELWDDRKGDLNKGMDLFLRSAISLAVSAIISHWFPIADSVALCLALHFLIFDYAIAWWLIRNGTIEEPRGAKYDWWSYTAKKGWMDNVEFWNRLNPWWKLAVRVVVFGGALTVWIA